MQRENNNISYFSYYWTEQSRQKIFLLIKYLKAQIQVQNAQAPKYYSNILGIYYVVKTYTIKIFAAEITSSIVLEM